MSTTVLRKIQLGKNADPNKNIVIETPTVEDGTLTIRRGNYDGTGTTILKLDQNGVVDDKPACSAQRTTPIALTDNTPTALDPNQVNYDLSKGTGGFAFGAYTIPRTGIYTVHLNVAFDVTSGVFGLAAAILWRNGVPVGEGTFIYNVAGVASNSQLSGDFLFNAGDTVAPLARAVSTTARVGSARFSIRYVRSAT